MRDHKVHHLFKTPKKIKNKVISLTCRYTLNELSTAEIKKAQKQPKQECIVSDTELDSYLPTIPFICDCIVNGKTRQLIINAQAQELGGLFMMGFTADPDTVKNISTRILTAWCSKVENYLQKASTEWLIKAIANPDKVVS